MVKNITLRYEDKEVPLVLSDDAAAICIKLYDLIEELKMWRTKR